MKRILCIRLDNMGDVIMSTPAIHALKTTFECHITLLTSSMGAVITPSIPDIDDTIIFDAPWVKNESPDATPVFNDTVEKLRQGNFDAAVIFTVYSQNPMPAAMLAYLANIPIRLAYCRENPYGLLTHWAPEKEPYDYIRHQVSRDLHLITHLDVTPSSDKLMLEVNEALWPDVRKKLQHCHIDPDKPWVVLHPGVSDNKRQYPVQQWIKAAKDLLRQTGVQLLITGTKAERALATAISHGINQENGVCVGAGLFSVAEFITLIRHSALVISVNTSTAHIAAAVQVPVVVLYAHTNPQHTPWKAQGAVLYFDVPEQLRSKNEVIRYVHEQYSYESQMPATTGNIVQVAAGILEPILDKQL
ncbi:glycosyltransferase family 9 protein [uncultured Chitinophaga sp.]|jgi:ADP-heptose:LPS heptosyltransferase|uniref:glycosyltransferase family 9 protein n=1 Tax=uncultured Chitinophaga sp. TaxID=339340 RepID=UPI002605E2BF|nr:glycosyltransferase family 9 protein [uncultured Chitinophaga sp.]